MVQVQVQDFFFLHLDRFGTIQLDSDLLVLKSKDLDFLARLWSPVLGLVRVWREEREDHLARLLVVVWVGSNLQFVNVMASNLCSPLA